MEGSSWPSLPLTLSVPILRSALQEQRKGRHRAGYGTGSELNAAPNPSYRRQGSGCIGLW